MTWNASIIKRKDDGHGPYKLILEAKNWPTSMEYGIAFSLRRRLWEITEYYIRERSRVVLVRDETTEIINR